MTPNTVERIEQERMQGPNKGVTVLIGALVIAGAAGSAIMAYLMQV